MYFTIFVLQKYLQYNIVITSEEKYHLNGITLPAVTICNSNRVHCRNLYNEASKAENEVVEMKLSHEYLKEVFNILSFIQGDSNLTQTLCKLFILSQCSITLTIWDYRNLKKRAWKDICLDFTQEPDNKTCTDIVTQTFVSPN